MKVFVSVMGLTVKPVSSGCWETRVPVTLTVTVNSSSSGRGMLSSMVMM